MVIKNRVVLVTGAGRGIGAAICRGLAADGARIIATARSQEQLDALLDELKPVRNDCLAIATDLTQPGEITALAEEILHDVGGVDVLINNAGVAWGRSLEDTALEDWRQLMALNVDAVFLLTQACLPMLRQSKVGQIVNIGSDASIRGIGRMSCYCASKFALRGFTMALREELKGSGIRLNLVMPGPVNTTIIAKTADHWEFIQPEDVAAVVRQIIALPATADVWETLIEPRG